MKSKKQWLDCARFREIDLVVYLGALGHQPTKIRHQDYWYLSPLRIEKTASFKVNRKLNSWYDHGIGQGGNFIVFAIFYHGCTIAELLQNLQGNSFLHQPTPRRQQEPGNQEQRIIILGNYLITSFKLLQYLIARRIPVDLVTSYCREVRYTTNGKTFYSIGFKNDRGGYELRNPICKNSAAPKGITTIQSSSSKVAVFEGFFDLLSFLFLIGKEQCKQWNYCVLNSLSFFEKARPFLESHQHIHLFFDNDTAGQNCSAYALSLDKRYVDERQTYKGRKDLNEWIVGMGT